MMLWWTCGRAVLPVDPQCTTVFAVFWMKMARRTRVKLTKKSLAAGGGNQWSVEALHYTLSKNCRTISKATSLDEQGTTSTLRLRCYGLSHNRKTCSWDVIDSLREASSRTFHICDCAAHVILPNHVTQPTRIHRRIPCRGSTNSLSKVQFCDVFVESGAHTPDE